MGSDVVLSAGVRQNLLALQSTAHLMATTQNRLSTGKRVNSALDNPVNFFTSGSLSSRAKDLTALLDSMANGIKTIEAADNGITAIKKTIESMKSTLLQARQDKSFKSSAYTVAVATPAPTDVLTFSGGAVTGSVNIDLTNSTAVRTSATNYADMDFNNAGAWAGQTLTFTIALNGGTARSVVIGATSDTNLTVAVDGGTATNYTIADSDAVTGAEMVAALNAGFDAAATPIAITASGSTGAPLVFTADTAVSSSTANIAVTTPVAAGAGQVLPASFGFVAAGTLTQTNTAAQTVDQIVAAINANTSLTDKVQASNDSGQIRILNESTIDLDIAGITGSVVDGGAGTTTIGGNQVRRNLVKQFNDLRDQLDKLADDASFNGVNLLRGDRLKITFNETGTSTIVIQATDEFGVPRPIDTNTLEIAFLQNPDVDADDSIDTLLEGLASSLNIVRAQASTFGSHLSIVEIRTDFTKSMVNTLQTGADNLVLADVNEESANMLALQTRQQLSTTALSLASQADQAVLRLFG
jgi:flagellin